LLPVAQTLFLSFRSRRVDIANRSNAMARTLKKRNLHGGLATHGL